MKKKKKKRSRVRVVTKKRAKVALLAVSVALVLVISVFLKAVTTHRKTFPPDISPNYQKDILLYSDDFDGNLDQWVIESAGNGFASIRDGAMHIIDDGGTTAWFYRPLTDSTSIEYKVRLLDEGANLTDINCFWMARDTKSAPPLSVEPEVFFDAGRTGIFSTYHTMHTYYCGFGANRNSTFRFRRYYDPTDIPAEVLDMPRDGNRVIVYNHDDSGEFREGDVFITAGTWYHIRLVYFNGLVEYFLNGEKAFSYVEQAYDTPYNKGYFGFRTTASVHAQLDSLRIYKLR
jgi:hypothetical protein